MTAQASAPRAPRQARDVSVHGDPRVDEYFWLRDRDDPRTLEYLKAENAYADAWFRPHAALQETLYQEMLSRIQQDDDSVPMRKGDWWYSTQTRRGEQYPHYLRRRALGPEHRYDPTGADETLLDLNELARDQPFLRLGLTTVSRDAMRLAYTTDVTGERDFTLHVNYLGPGAVDASSVDEVASAASANDSRTLYCVTIDETTGESPLASRRRHGAADELLYERTTSCSTSASARRSTSAPSCSASRAGSTEWRVAAADATGDQPFAPRIVFAAAPTSSTTSTPRGRFFIHIDDRPQLASSRSTPQRPSSRRRRS